MYFNPGSVIQPMSLDQIIKKAPAVTAERPHERTSERYLFIPTIKIVDGLMKNGWNVVSAVQSRGDKDSGKHALMLVHGSEMGSLEVDAVRPMLKLENSHNGLSSFHLSAALYRKVCANGLTVPEKMLVAPRVKHTKYIDKETIEASFKIIDEFPTLMNKVEAMRSVELSNEEQYLFAQSAARLIYEPEQIERTIQGYRKENVVEQQLLTPWRYADKQNDLWSVLNRVQENAIRGGVKLVGESNKARRTRKVNNIDRDSKINQELLTLANEMARIKGVAA